MVSSLHAFLPLADEYGIGRLHRMILGLPHNAGGRSISSATRERRAVSELLLRFLAHSTAQRTPGALDLPRGIDVSRNGIPRIADERLRKMLLASSPEDVQRIIRMYADGDDLDRIESRLANHVAFDDGAHTAAAVRPWTWHRNPPALVDPAFSRNEFAELRSVVEKARRRRTGWILAVLIETPLVLATLSGFF